MRSMFRSACRSVIIFVLIFLIAAKAGSAQSKTQKIEEIDDYIHHVMSSFPINGMAIGIVQGNQVLYLQGYGTANQMGQPVTPQTPFMLASLTKTFTALAMQQLAENGKLNLDEPVQNYIPEFRLNEINSASLITVRDLLNHTSGISTREGIEPYLYAENAVFEEVIGQLARFQPEFPAGTQYEYSNWNYVLLGKIIERVSGEPYADYVQTHILDPLKMDHSSFEDYHAIEGSATGNLIVFGVPVPYDEKHRPLLASAGDLTSTAEDMTHYLLAYFDQAREGCEGLLCEKGSGWFDPTWNWHPGKPGDISYGYSGGHNSFNSAFQLFSLHQVGVVVLMNTRLDTVTGGPSASEIAFNIARIVIDFPYEIPSNRAFYFGYGMLVLLMISLLGSIIRQISTLPQWIVFARSVSPGANLVKIGVGIIANLLVGAGILLYPFFTGATWKTLLFHRLENSLPFFGAGILLVVIGLSKFCIQCAWLIRKSNPKFMKKPEFGKE